jgi:hypothetical protein
VRRSLHTSRTKERADDAALPGRVGGDVGQLAGDKWCSTEQDAREQSAADHVCATKVDGREESARDEGRWTEGAGPEEAREEDGCLTDKDGCEQSAGDNRHRIQEDQFAASSIAPKVGDGGQECRGRDVKRGSDGGRVEIVWGKAAPGALHISVGDGLLAMGCDVGDLYLWDAATGGHVR